MTLSVKYSRKTLVLSNDVMTRNMLHYSFSDGVHHPLMLLDRLKYGQSVHRCNANMHRFIPPMLSVLTLWYCTHPNLLNHLYKYF